MSSCGRVFKNFGPEHFTENCMTFVRAGYWITLIVAGIPCIVFVYGYTLTKVVIEI